YAFAIFLHGMWTSFFQPAFAIASFMHSARVTASTIWPVHFKSGARPSMVKNRISRLAGHKLGADFGLAQVLFVERKPLPRFELVLRRGLHVLVEARNQDLTL